MRGSLRPGERRRRRARPGRGSGRRPFTHKFISQTHALTVADADGPRLTIRQVAADGQELDKLTIEER
jgi:hypothetical protein